MNEHKALARQIAQALNETNVYLIGQVIDIFGPEFTQKLVEQTLQVEAQGGVPTVEGDRQRTPGGVFFYLAREYTTKSTDRKRLRTPFNPRAKKAKAGDPNQPNHDGQPTVVEPADILPKFEWDAREEIYRILDSGKGEASTVKMTLIGRPNRVEKRLDVVIARFTHSHKLPVGLPKGVPQPPAQPTEYAVYIAAKQWRPLESSLVANAEAGIVVEGICAYDPALPGLAVFATKVMLKQVKKRDLQAPGEDQSGDAATASARPAASRQGPKQAAKPAVKPPPPPPSPEQQATLEEARQRLTEARAAEDGARAELERLKSLPAAEQVGLAQTLQTLQQAKRQREQLEGRFPQLRRM